MGPLGIRRVGMSGPGVNMCVMDAAPVRFPASLFRRRRRKDRRAARLAADAARFERAAQRLERELGSAEPWQVRHLRRSAQECLRMAADEQLAA